MIGAFAGVGDEKKSPEGDPGPLKNYRLDELLRFVDLGTFVFLAIGASVVRKFGFAAFGARDCLDSREAIVDGTTHIGTGMTDAFLRNCHF